LRADPLTPRRDFGDPGVELRHALDSCAVAQRSHLSRLLATGPDLLDLLHRLSTGDVRGLEPGRGRPTVVTTPKGRIVDRLFVHHLGQRGVLMVGGAGSASRVAEHLARYAFAEDTGVADATATTCHVAWVGPRAAEAVAAAGLPVPDTHAAVAATLDGVPVHVLGQDGWSAAGFSVVAEQSAAAAVWESCVAAAARTDGGPAGERALDAYRVLRGIPIAGHELTSDYNPLEAGLWDAVSFDKGCYVGQEVVARLRTYDKVSRTIVRLDIDVADGSSAPAPGTPLVVGGKPVGTLTSVAFPPGSPPTGLGYVKRRELEAGGDLRAGDSDSAPRARVVQVFGPGSA